jgi:hypothetical protein
MKSRKIIVDRPHVDATEISARRNFNEILGQHAIMAKPFYKQYWFMGTTGLASLGLIIGGTILLKTDDDYPPAHNLSIVEQTTTDAAPQEIKMSGEKPPETKLYLAMNEQSTEKKQLNNKKEIYDKNSTSNVKESKLQVSVETESVQPISKDEIISEQRAKFNQADVVSVNTGNDLSPRISNKIGGEITRSELLDNKGITTAADASIIHFEMHLIDGLGGQVFEAEDNQLNEEMKQALSKVRKGETVYFENIRARVRDGLEVKLNPLKYVLLN